MRQHLLDAAPKKVLLAKNNDAGMPYTVDLLAKKLLRHRLGEAIREVIHMQRYLPAYRPRTSMQNQAS